jgi:hypothetical protein
MELRHEARADEADPERTCCASHACFTEKASLGGAKDLFNQVD